MITRQDEEILGLLLGVDVIPDDVRREVAMRTRWYHSAGHGGAMGALGLIDALRFLGYERKQSVDSVQPVEWRQYPAGTLVEVCVDGNWSPGEYLGLAVDGRLAVRSVGDAWVREYRRDQVRLSDTMSHAEPVEETGEFVAIQLTPEEVEALVDPGDVLPADAGAPPAPEPEEDDGPLPDFVSRLAAGAEVLVEIADEILDGRFEAVSDGKLLVWIDGETEPRRVSAKNVQPLNDPEE